jgi:hypothetical protein
MKIPESKRSKIGIIAESRGIPNGFPNLPIIWITADLNVKDALANLQMELEGKHSQIRWKAAHKKNTKNHIVVYGLPLCFDPMGIMRELMYGLKESKKELCDAKKFSLEQNSYHRNCLSHYSTDTIGSPSHQK